MLNSRLGLFTAASSGFHPIEAPLLPKLRGHFAEFLNESSPERLRILTPPTCVGLRYGYLTLTRGFSWQLEIRDFGTIIFPRLNSLALTEMRICLHFLPHCLDALFHQRARPTLLRHPIAQTSFGSTGISTCCPSPTLFCLGLGPD